LKTIAALFFAAVPDLAQSLTRRIVGAYDSDSLSARARQKRWHQFEAAFPDISELTVLDLGGDARAWRSAPVRPRRVILVNVFDQEVEEPWMEALNADACDPEADLPGADLIYSNSVIEHVGGHWRRQRFAAAVRKADRYWVQTPNRYFPIEPHFMMPWLQHFPLRAKAFLVAHWPVGHYASYRDREKILEGAMDIELLSGAEMGIYFPDAEIRRERVLGLTKSLIAVKQR
jgi:hypothetical protein